jgi:enamine deaminase RidA (YjgF/YER057c/UK114 family)
MKNKPEIMHLAEVEIKSKKIKEAKNCFLYSPEYGTREAHVLIQSDPGLTTEQSWCSIIEKLEKKENQLGFSRDSRLFFRVFLSDALNQERILREKFPEYFEDLNRACISLVQQPAVRGSKLALWVYLVDGENKVHITKMGRVFNSNGLSHLWSANFTGDQSLNTFGQTEGIFTKYIQALEQFQSYMFLNAIRTWIFVRDVDTLYNDVVKARKLIFKGLGLNENTHYIASTGIEGRNENPAISVFMDTYSIAGIKPDQIRFLTAPNHLCSTNKYGVTFERGTSIEYGDRKHVFISGTASIDKNGAVLYPEDVEMQTVRVVENIEALLNAASCSLSDLAMALIYLRDIADYERVKKITDELLPEVPSLILLAPVCRPEWLVEIEVIAIKELVYDEVKSVAPY